jgi:hypothetical protein
MIIHLLVVLFVIGVVLYLLNTLVPMDDRFKKAINIIVIACVFLYVLQCFGIISGFPNFR